METPIRHRSASILNYDSMSEHAAPSRNEVNKDSSQRYQQTPLSTSDTHGLATPTINEDEIDERTSVLSFNSSLDTNETTSQISSSIWTTSSNTGSIDDVLPLSKTHAVMDLVKSIWRNVKGVAKKTCG